MRIPPRSGGVVAWLDAWRRGACDSEAVERGIVGPDALHRVRLPASAEPVPWSAALDLLPLDGGVGLALPVPGDPAGLTGSALAAAVGEEAALVAGGVLLPEVGGPPGERVVEWRYVPGEPPGVVAPDLPDADRALRVSLLEAAGEMEALGLDRPRADVARRLAHVERRLADQPLPSTVPQRAVVLLRTAGRLLAATSMALEDDGGALTAVEAQRRRDALGPLRTACRRALEAAYASGAGKAAARG